MDKILKNASFKVLRNEIREHRKKLDEINKELYHLHLELSKVLQPEDWDTVDRVTYCQAEFTHQEVKRTQQRKFDNLYSASAKESLDAKKVIINLTDKPLDSAAENALKKGFNYSIAPRRIPVEEIICSIESAITELPTEISEEIRQDVSSLIRKSKPPKRNITKAEEEALKNMKKDPEIVILPADKGNATVVMKSSDYKDKMRSLLEERTYSKTRNPTQKIKTQLNKIIKETTLPDEEKRKLLAQDPKPPLLYGLPKIHKPGVPMRPIVSAIGSATHKAARYIARELQPMTGKTSSFIKNSAHFVEKLSSLQLREEDLLVSFDVVSLFTNIPVDDTIQLLKGKISEDMTKLAEICLKSTYFLFEGEFYRQIEGSPMGSPMSPVIANIFMEHFEETALNSASIKPICWWRYVDDVFLVWRHGRSALDAFLNHMNSIHESIQFTMELEKDGTLPFLDVLVTRKNNGTIGHKVYRKPTHTDRYLHGDSHHHPSQKSSVLSSLVSRGLSVCDKDSWEEEKQHLRTALERNSYDIRTINRIIHRQEEREGDTEEVGQPQHMRKAYLPYVKGTTDKISRLLKRHEISTVFTTGTTTRHLIGSVKDSLHLKTSGVYEIPCSCGKSYIGQTGRLISTRLQEHIRAVKNNDLKSAVAEHSADTGHYVKFEDTRVLSSNSRYHSRIVREAIEIEKHPDNYNREDGFRLSRTWKPLICKLAHQRQGTQPPRSDLESPGINNEANHLPPGNPHRGTSSPCPDLTGLRNTQQSGVNKSVYHLRQRPPRVYNNAAPSVPPVSPAVL